jgi:hypothetical protein
MSQIAALFMIVFNDETTAFWSFASLMIKTPWTQKGMFLPGFPKLNQFIQLWEAIFQTYLPKLHDHFESEAVIPQIFLTKWYLQNFLDRLPFHLCVRLWDIFFLEGDYVILATTLTLLRLKQQNMLRMDFDGIAQFLQQDICNVNCTDDQLFILIQKDLNAIRNSGQFRPMSPIAYSPKPKARSRKNRPVPVPRSKSSKSRGRTPERVPNPQTESSSSYDNYNKNDDDQTTNIRSHIERFVKKRASSPESSSSRENVIQIKPRPKPRSSIASSNSKISTATSPNQSITSRVDVIPEHRLIQNQDFRQISDWAKKYSRHGRDL